MFGGVLPGKKSRGGSPFVNLFDSLENATRPGAKMPVAATAQSAGVATKSNPTIRLAQTASETSKQIAAAMIRSMLGSQPTAPEMEGQHGNTAKQPASVEAAPATSSEPVMESTSAEGAPTAGNIPSNTLIAAMLGSRPAVVTETASALSSNVEEAAPTAETVAPAAMEIEMPVKTPAPVSADRPLSKNARLEPTGSRTQAPIESTMNGAASAAATSSNVAPAIPSTISPASTATPTPAPVHFDAQTAPATVRMASTEIAARSAAPVSPTEAAQGSGNDAEIVEPAVSTTASKIADTAVPVAFTMRLTSLTPASEISSQATPAPAEINADPVSFRASAKTTDLDSGAHEDDKESREANPRTARTPETASQTATPDQAAVRADSAQGSGATPITNTVPFASETGAARTIAPAARDLEPAAAQTPDTQSIAATPAPVPATQNAPVQAIALRIAQPEMPAVELHVTERAGEIHVAVRTPDIELQSSLRQDLGTLSSSLERAGYHAETFVPRAAAGSQMSLREDRQSQQGFSGRGGSQSESEGGKQKGQRERRSTSWLDELENAK